MPTWRGSNDRLHPPRRARRHPRGTVGIRAGYRRSDLAAACNAAAKRWALVTDRSLPAEAFTDEQVDAEIDHCTAVLERCVQEPSQGPRDLAAKARLMIAEHDDGDEFVGHRALIALLHEVVALCG